MKGAWAIGQEGGAARNNRGLGHGGAWLSAGLGLRARAGLGRRFGFVVEGGLDVLDEVLGGVAAAELGF